MNGACAGVTGPVVCGSPCWLSQAALALFCERAQQASIKTSLPPSHSPRNQLLSRNDGVSRTQQLRRFLRN
eukprot:1724679-Rhodomonas_salina.2